MHFRWVNVLLFIMIKSLTIMYWSCTGPQLPGKSSLKLNNIVIMFNYGSYWQHFFAFTWNCWKAHFSCYYFVPDGHCMPLLHCTFPLLFLLAYLHDFLRLIVESFCIFRKFRELRWWSEPGRVLSWKWCRSWITKTCFIQTCPLRFSSPLLFPLIAVERVGWFG